jgi:hypothetical protein
MVHAVNTWSLIVGGRRWLRSECIRFLVFLRRNCFYRIDYWKNRPKTLLTLKMFQTSDMKQTVKLLPLTNLEVYTTGWFKKTNSKLFRFLQYVCKDHLNTLFLISSNKWLRADTKIRYEIVALLIFSGAIFTKLLKTNS